MLNIMALMPEIHPISETPNIFDKSQSIGRGSLRGDGLISTIATNASFWSFVDARTLTPMELAALMGHKKSELNLADIKKSAFKRMIGLSLHVGTAGMVMSVLLPGLADGPRGGAME